jgi:hypothetical protein
LVSKYLFATASAQFGVSATGRTRKQIADAVIAWQRTLPKGP